MSDALVWDVEAARPRVRRRWLLRTGVVVSAAVAGCWALFILGCVALWIEAQAAMDEWTELGGVVSVEGNLFAPKSIFFGSAPGVRTSRDVDDVCDSLRRMRRLPGCTDLQMSSFGDFAIDDAGIERMLDAFEPVGFAASGVDLDDDALRLLAENECTESVSLDGRSVTERGLETLLDQPRIRSAYIQSDDLTDSERERLQTKYGDRIAFR